jgi:DNA topoisomerase-3
MLAVEWCRYYRMSSQATMSAAEKLYQRGILSYPRTETEVFADSFDLKALVNLQRDDQQWGAYARTLVDDGKFLWPRVSVEL